MDNRWVTRAYTLSSAADQTEMYEITVKREEFGEFSRWLCDRADSYQVAVGGVILISCQRRVYQSGNSDKSQ